MRLIRYIMLSEAKEGRRCWGGVFWACGGLLRGPGGASSLLAKSGEEVA